MRVEMNHSEEQTFARSTGAEEHSPFRTFIPLLNVLLHLEAHLHFFPSSATIPTKPMGWAERVTHNDVITSPGSQETLKREENGGRDVQHHG